MAHNLHCSSSVHCFSPLLVFLRQSFSLVNDPNGNVTLPVPNAALWPAALPACAPASLPPASLRPGQPAPRLAGRPAPQWSQMPWTSQTWSDFTNFFRRQFYKISVSGHGMHFIFKICPSKPTRRHRPIGRWRRKRALASVGAALCLKIRFFFQVNSWMAILRQHKILSGTYHFCHRLGTKKTPS